MRARVCVFVCLLRNQSGLVRYAHVDKRRTLTLTHGGALLSDHFTRCGGCGRARLVLTRPTPNRPRRRLHATHKRIVANVDDTTTPNATATQIRALGSLLEADGGGRGGCAGRSDLTGRAMRQRSATLGLVRVVRWVISCVSWGATWLWYGSFSPTLSRTVGSHRLPYGSPRCAAAWRCEPGVRV